MKKPAEVVAQQLYDEYKAKIFTAIAETFGMDITIFHKGICTAAIIAVRCAMEAAPPADAPYWLQVGNALENLQP